MVDEKQQKDEDISDMDAQPEDDKQNTFRELWIAVEINDSDRVAAFLDTYEEKFGSELQETQLYDSNGNSVIHKAASLGHAEVLMQLLERTGAKPDLVNGSLATPLHLACKNDRLDAAKFLVGCGVDANSQDEHGQNSLLICCIHGHFDLARMLIEASISGHLPEPLEIDSKDHRGLSPLNCAAIKGDFDLVKLLIINGSANVDSPSPKGCTPLLYAARGGYADVVRFLLHRGASPLIQDHAGGTVLHHAIEKGHVDVLNVLQEQGIDIHTSIEIPDNAGRTPVFEAIDNHESPYILRLLTKSRKDGGFEAKLNIMNYNGQTPLFSAAREGHIEIIKVMIEDCDCRVDLTGGELFKEDYDEGEEKYDSLEEKFFMEAYKNCMTPLHVAVVLGYEEIMMYLIEQGANPNLQTKIKGYTALHLAVLANKPEIIIELLTKTQANPQLPDFSGRTLQDMVEIYLPSYVDSFKTLIDNLQALKQKKEDEEVRLEVIAEETIGGLASQASSGELAPVVVKHYYNPEDERTIKGVGENSEAIKDLYSKKVDGEEEGSGNKDQGSSSQGKSAGQQFEEMGEADIKVENEQMIDGHVEFIFGKKVARAVVSSDWKMKEVGLKKVYKLVDKHLNSTKEDEAITDEDKIKGAAIVVGLTCREKVIKVFSVSLQLLNLLIASQKIEKAGKMEILKNIIIEKNVVPKLLQKSEEGNTRVTNKIHECLLDMSFNPEIGEGLVASFILQRIHSHNKAGLLKQAQINTQNQLDADGEVKQVPEKIQTEASLGSFKGLLAQLAILYKLINSFGISSKSRGALSVKNVLKSIIPAVSHQNQDVRNALSKILMDVQRLSGCITEEELEDLPEKQRQAILDKIKNVEVEKNLQDQALQNLHDKSAIKNVKAIKEEEGDETDGAEVPETISTNSPVKKDNFKDRLNDAKALIEQKGNSKDWQERELALKAIDDIFTQKTNQAGLKDLLEEAFLNHCLMLLKNCLEENNMTIYLQAIQVAEKFFHKALIADVVRTSLEGLVNPMALRTTETNTRIRKKSVEVLNQIWDYKEQQQMQDKLHFGKLRDSQMGSNFKTDPICQIIATVLCDPTHGEKAIIGRLGLFIKRAMLIEGAKDLINKPLQMILGKSYEQLAEFACSWVQHKNTKVRQNASKLLIEVCRINCMDPRGQPFKQRMINFILGLRANQRDPLILKINDVCRQAIVKDTSPGRANDLEPFINTDDLDLNIPGKSRAASMDQIGAKRRMMSATRRTGSRGQNEGNTAMLPSISVAQPAQGPVGSQSRMQPTIVLPHAEPMSEEQKKQYEGLVDFFGLQLITCTLSKNWAARYAALQKVEEQLHNLDPHRRDPMSAEINLQNMPIEISFKTFIEYLGEGMKDPVLKNYIQLLALVQKSLPTFFRYLPSQTIRSELTPLISQILRRTTDMKQKIRESSINFSLYLSHQSPVGPEFMVGEVLKELDLIQNEKNDLGKANSAAVNFGNSHMISACLGLLHSFQEQSKLLTPEKDTKDLLSKFMTQVNFALRHSNPQVRKEAEKLFRILYCQFGTSLEEKLVNQKQAILSKILTAAKQDLLAMDVPSTTKDSGAKPKRENSQVQKFKEEMANREKMEKNLQRAQHHIRDQTLIQSSLGKILEGVDDHVQALKLPNPKQRQKAIIEIKKAISKKVVGQLSSEKARELFEPLTLLIRQLLQDDSKEIYLEALNLLKFIVGSLAPSLTTLDLHLMMGSFIGIIVQNTASSENMRIQVQSDKVIVFFAKHQNIGPFVVAKEVNKNLERINKEILANVGPRKQELLAEKKPLLLRFYGILQLLLQQFSIVLCYQSEFYVKCLECLADTLNACNSKSPQDGDEQAIKGTCIQIVNNLYAIDYKLLDVSVSKLGDLNRKTPLRKAIIEHEQQQREGKGYIDLGRSQEAKVPGEQNMRDTQMSFASSSIRQSLFSPGSTITRGQSPGAFGSSQYDGWSSRFDKSAQNQTITQTDKVPKRMMSLGEKRESGSGTISTGQTQAEYLANHPVSNQTQTSWRRQRDVLPPLEGVGQNLNRTGVLLPKIGGTQGIGAGLNPSYNFEPGPRKDEAEKSKASFKAQPKLKSTGGAGFSSQPTASASGESENVPLYEPTIGQRRLPRRDIKGIGEPKTLMGSRPIIPPSNNATGMQHAPMGSSQPEPKREVPIPRKTSQTRIPMGAAGGSKKPPLYVPGARGTSETRRSIERKENNSRSQNAPSYSSKTGFSSILPVPEPTKEVEKKQSGAPFEKRAKGIGAAAFGQQPPQAALGNIQVINYPQQ